MTWSCLFFGHHHVDVGCRENNPKIKSIMKLIKLRTRNWRLLMNNKLYLLLGLSLMSFNAFSSLNCTLALKSDSKIIKKINMLFPDQYTLDSETSQKTFRIGPLSNDKFKDLVLKAKVVKRSESALTYTISAKTSDHFLNHTSDELEITKSSEIYLGENNMNEEYWISFNCIPPHVETFRNFNLENNHASDEIE